jgi:hypothetical protein
LGIVRTVFAAHDLSWTGNDKLPFRNYNMKDSATNEKGSARIYRITSVERDNSKTDLNSQWISTGAAAELDKKERAAPEL